MRGAPATILLAYRVLGMPPATASLPLYVYLAKFYGDHLGVDPALLGGVLLALGVHLDVASSVLATPGHRDTAALTALATV